jgi:hypothetical protein
MTQSDQEPSKLPPPVSKQSAEFLFDPSAKTEELLKLGLNLSVEDRIKLSESERTSRESKVRQRKEIFVDALALIILFVVIISAILIIKDPQSLQADKDWAKGTVTTIVTATVGYIFVQKSKKE